MKRYLISYADHNFRRQQILWEKSARFFSCKTEVVSYGPDDICRDFYTSNYDVLSERKGGGFWLWKPYLILKTLNEMEYGDLLFYMDSGSVFCKGVSGLFNKLEFQNQDVVSFETPFIEREYSQKRTIEYMLEGLDPNQFISVINSNQIQATFQFVRKSEESIRFYSELLELSTNPDLIKDADTLAEESYGLVAHRHDQSIFSLLYKKYGYRALRDITQFGLYPECYDNDRFTKLPRNVLVQDSSGSRSFYVNENIQSIGFYIFLYRSRRFHLAVIKHLLWLIKFNWLKK